MSGKEANMFNEVLDSSEESSDLTSYSTSAESDSEEGYNNGDEHSSDDSSDEDSSRQDGDGMDDVAVREYGDGDNAVRRQLVIEERRDIAFDYEITSDESDVTEEFTETHYVCACKRRINFPSMEDPWACLLDKAAVNTIAFMFIFLFVNIFMPASHSQAVMLNVATCLVLFTVLYAIAMFAVWIFVWLVNSYFLFSGHQHYDDDYPDNIPRPRRPTLERLIHM